MAVEVRRARLVLPASGSTPARMQVVHRGPRVRAARALGALGGAGFLAPAVFFIPPHVVWPVLVVAAGLYVGWREWRGEYVVHSFEGSCPRCGEVLTVKDGARIRDGQRVECYSCHREPKLILEDDDE